MFCNFLFLFCDNLDYFLGVGVMGENSKFVGIFFNFMKGMKSNNDKNISIKKNTECKNKHCNSTSIQGMQRSNAFCP